MTIKPDDPWYPIDFACVDNCPDKGVPIRLKLAAMAMQGILTGCTEPDDDYPVGWINESAFTMADAMIKRANREEGKAG